MYTDDERKLKELVEQEIKQFERLSKLLKLTLIITLIAGVLSAYIGHLMYN